MKERATIYLLIPCLLCVAVLVQLTFGFLLGKETLFLLFFPAVLAGAWYGGFKPGVISTTFASAAMAYFLFQETITLSLIVHIYLFFGEGVLTSFLIDKLRRTEILNEFKRRESAQADVVANLKKKYALVQEEVKARDEFLSIASHELKTPLTSMLLQIRTALHNIQNVSLANFSVEKLLRMLESAERQTTRLSKMINDLLNVSLITTKKLDLEFEQFDISKLTNDVTENFQERLKREENTLLLNIQPAIIGTWDKLRIEQAITNLVSNAIKYGDKKPIEISVKNHDVTVRISVADHGIGIPAAQKEKIFALFERGSLSSKYKGLGVGLFITDQIVKAHHGKIDVKSKERKGSTFIMELPLKPSPSVNAN